jgi:hypothetical protein
MVRILTIAITLGISLFIVRCEHSQMQSCLKNGERALVNGVVRRAGSSYYVYTSQHNWKEIMPAAGRYPTNRQLVLNKNIGNPIDVVYCDDKVISFTVEGETYISWTVAP